MVLTIAYTGTGPEEASPHDKLMSNDPIRYLRQIALTPRWILSRGRSSRPLRIIFLKLPMLAFPFSTPSLTVLKCLRIGEMFSSVVTTAFLDLFLGP